MRKIIINSYNLLVSLTPSSLLTSALIIIGVAPSMTCATLRINNERIRLYGIDAPEIKPSCTLNNEVKSCGKESKAFVQSLAEGKEVNCVGKCKDKYKCTVAICYERSIDLNARMMHQGQALVYRQYSKACIGAESLLSWGFGLKGLKCRGSGGRKARLDIETW